MALLLLTPPSASLASTRPSLPAPALATLVASGESPPSTNSAALSTAIPLASSNATRLRNSPSSTAPPGVNSNRSTTTPLTLPSTVTIRWTKETRTTTKTMTTKTTISCLKMVASPVVSPPPPLASRLLITLNSERRLLSLPLLPKCPSPLLHHLLLLPTRSFPRLILSLLVGPYSDRPCATTSHPLLRAPATSRVPTLTASTFWAHARGCKRLRSLLILLSSRPLKKVSLTV
mmetsp:Transcript_53306/g.88567  ORF Transcript_53306/g.88567 Transcript_53306/m.88567 type:complete len:233 (-) Transcript_53306:150-848(-)